MKLSSTTRWFCPGSCNISLTWPSDQEASGSSYCGQRSCSMAPMFFGKCTCIPHARNIAESSVNESVITAKEWISSQEVQVRTHLALQLGLTEKINPISEIMSIITLTSMLPLSWIGLAISLPVYCFLEGVGATAGGEGAMAGSMTHLFGFFQQFNSKISEKICASSKTTGKHLRARC